MLAEHVGYLQQEGRLLSGTLRENLVLGLLDPGDEAILAAARQTGLYRSVIATHPSGLQQVIAEGGTGLSNGQRQLVNLTRVFLRRPTVWLLDEPTASLDMASELAARAALQEAIRPQDTLILVTHRLDLLQLVDRVLVIAHHGIAADGPATEVVPHLKRMAPPAPQKTESRNGQA